MAVDEVSDRRTGVFTHVVVGVDGTAPSLEACAQAARLVDRDGSLELLAVVHFAEAALAGYTSSRLADELGREAEAALIAAKAVAGENATTELLNGPAAATLRYELARRESTLVAVGTHGHSRASEIVLGGVAGELLHDAPCSVLVVRAPADAAAFPRTIVAGIDGSSEAEAALEVARGLGRRFDATLRIVTALDCKDIDLDRVHAVAPDGETLPGRPADVLVEATADTDVLVVGSRGLHGLRALGSVSERVAHRAPSSVLVVRARTS